MVKVTRGKTEWVCMKKKTAEQVKVLIDFFAGVVLACWTAAEPLRCLFDGGKWSLSRTASR